MKDRIVLEDPVRQANIQSQTSRSRDRLEGAAAKAFSAMAPNQSHLRMVTTANLQVNTQNHQTLLHS